MIISQLEGSEMRALRFTMLLIVAIVASTITNVSQAQFSTDAHWIPQGANCLVLVNGERIFESDLAKRENWADLNSGSFERGTSLVPPNVNRMLLATQLDLAYMHPIWTVAVLADDHQKFDLSAIAKARKATLDSIGQHPALHLPSDILLVELDPQTLGAMVPANRQALARWVDGKEAAGLSASPYLAEAVTFADKNSDVIVAFDLRDAIDVDTARSRLKTSGKVQASDIEAAAKALSKLRGVTLGITVRDAITAALKVDFAAGTNGVDKLGKEVIIGALENQGVMIDDIRQWTFSQKADTLTLQGKLSDTGLRQINSIIAQPVQAIFRGIGSASDGANKGPDMSPAASTKRYLDKLDICFMELEEFTKKTGGLSAKPYFRWFESYADQLDQMPQEGVDPALLEYGAKAAKGFRDIGQILVAVDAETVAEGDAAVQNRGGSYVAYGYGYGYGYGYRYRPPSKTSIRKAVRTQNYQQARIQINEILTHLKDELSTVRHSMDTGSQK